MSVGELWDTVSRHLGAWGWLACSVTLLFVLLRRRQQERIRPGVVLLVLLGCTVVGYVLVRSI